MSGHEVNIYADHAEMIALLEAFDKSVDFRYTLVDSEVDQPNIQFDSARRLAPFFLSTAKQTSIGAILVTDPQLTLRTRQITMMGGGVKTIADNTYNPDAVVIILGGEIVAESTLISTSINTLGESKRANEKFKLFKQIILRKAKYINGFYVFPLALEKFNTGWRLTPGLSYSTDLDL